MAKQTKSVIEVGFEGIEVIVECNLSNGLPNVTIVGLASKAVDEAKERLRVAIKNSGLEFPKKRIVFNLAPAELPKDTTSLDVAMAVALLSADGQVNNVSEMVFIGELTLSGDIKPVRGIIGKLLSPTCKNAKMIFVPKDNAAQASLVGLDNIYAVSTLKELIEFLVNGTGAKNQIEKTKISESNNRKPVIDFGEIHGQQTAKRALEIAAAGGHNVLLSGPPGTGKSMLAKAFTGLLPDLNQNESLEVTHLHSLATRKYDTVITSPPLRAPHHTSSDIAIIGGGHNLRPGEISLAHHGVLFLDELPEFHRYALEALRQPLEDGVVTIARANQTATFPANFILIATSNPCPCGYLNSNKPCTCSPSQIQRYQKKISGPILDRIDIHVTVGTVEHETLLKQTGSKISPQLRKTVSKARDIQIKRQSGMLNSNLSNSDIKKFAPLELSAQELLNSAARQLDISARSYMRIVKLARTIADIAESKSINSNHIAEALQYRPKQQNL